MYLQIDKTDDDETENIDKFNIFHDDNTSYSRCFARYTGLLIIIICLFAIPTTIMRLVDDHPTYPLQQQYTPIKNCSSNEVISANLGHLPGWKHDLLTIAYDEDNITGGVSVPVYMSQSIDNALPRVMYAYIIQHGNLRNGFDYYCAARNSIDATDWDKSNVFIIAPQFLVENDTCYKDSTSYQVNIEKGHTCNLPIWSSEGWKDGHLSRTHPYLYSYDVFDAIINILGDINLFPNLKVISFFGFSAGGQIALRYAAMPSYHLDSTRVKVRFIVSDPSTFLYLNHHRPFTNGSIGFGVPDASWLPSQWQRSAMDGSSWEGSWDSNCEAYNNWRYGLDNLVGYADHKAHQDPNFIDNMIRDFQYRDVTYLLGSSDDVNCKLMNSTFYSRNSNNNNHPCDDHDLATYCQAMLQGTNRVDRMLKWIAYLGDLYGNAIHRFVEVPGVSHDPVAMLSSSLGKCIVFGICDSSFSLHRPSFPDPTYSPAL